MRDTRQSVSSYAGTFPVKNPSLDAMHLSRAAEASETSTADHRMQRDITRTRDQIEVPHADSFGLRGCQYKTFTRLISCRETSSSDRMLSLSAQDAFLDRLKFFSLADLVANCRRAQLLDAVGRRSSTRQLCLSLAFMRAGTKDGIMI